ncbi:MAG: hypothetical protein Kow0025_01200 [Thermodesulfovibrionales bacterium]
MGKMKKTVAEVRALGKKDAVLQEGKSRKPLLIGAAAAVLAAAFVAFVLFSGNPKGNAFASVKAEAGEVKIPLDEVEDGHAHYYTYQTAGGPVNFFVLRSSDGVVRAAFDACDVCYRAKKGYRQEGDFMVCNNCGQRFPSTQINVLRGGCNPAPVERNIQERFLVIKASDIEAGKGYF